MHSECAKQAAVKLEELLNQHHGADFANDLVLASYKTWLSSSNPPFTLWFTGLSGAGKSTLAEMVHEELTIRNTAIKLLDGDVVRTNISKGLGFGKEDRDINIRRIGWICQLLNSYGVSVIVAAISPYKEIRAEVRQSVDNFIEVYVKCSIKTLIDRDVKGLYKKALNREIKNFTGISDPYEEPLSPEIIVETDKESTGESFNKIKRRLRCF